MTSSNSMLLFLLRPLAGKLSVHEKLRLLCTLTTKISLNNTMFCYWTSLYLPPEVQFKLKTLKITVEGSDFWDESYYYVYIRVRDWVRHFS